MRWKNRIGKHAGNEKYAHARLTPRRKKAFAVKRETRRSSPASPPCHRVTPTRCASLPMPSRY